MQEPLPPDVDDLSIPHDELLYIRVPPDPDAIKFDEAAGKHRPSSANFKTRGNETHPLSVDLSSICTPHETRDREQSRPFHVAAFTAGDARSVGCRIVRDPRPAEYGRLPNPAHALVFGDNNNRSGELKLSTQGKPLSRKAEIVLWNEKARSRPTFSL
jgi:hypothetical protein